MTQLGSSPFPWSSWKSDRAPPLSWLRNLWREPSRSRSLQSYPQWSWSGCQPSSGAAEIVHRSRLSVCGAVPSDIPSWQPPCPWYSTCGCECYYGSGSPAHTWWTCWCSWAHACSAANRCKKYSRVFSARIHPPCRALRWGYLYGWVPCCRVQPTFNKYLHKVVNSFSIQ